LSKDIIAQTVDKDHPIIIDVDAAANDGEGKLIFRN
jgi:hypothetical protein